MLTDHHAMLAWIPACYSSRRQRVVSHVDQCRRQLRDVQLPFSYQRHFYKLAQSRQISPDSRAALQFHKPAKLQRNWLRQKGGSPASKTVSEHGSG